MEVTRQTTSKIVSVYYRNPEHVEIPIKEINISLTDFSVVSAKS